ncbi:hypothetical protein TrST_g12401 [Triparma strigata]|uniref:tubulin-glutamate carboxypeptidase n=1 Tax=Triparma strigata TaxID=1606541 RepID=A0A9W7E093_9STRA|nr:hypothetical protein TrST_g12401 [Triparma strigata]
MSHNHSSSRVHEILQRMQENMSHVDSLKTCCGVLAILSRDEANKLLIARDGIRLLTTVMNTHISNPGLQEAACDLIWSLAFNNNLVKEVIGRQGGIPVIIKGMRLHASCADFLKSSCGALSNMCQNTHNQSLIAAHGGIGCILEALKRHKSNSILLPFIFDALASLIVGNERNSREVSETGAITLILESIREHCSKGELVKSGCHALAILSDSQGQGAKISAADGVKVLLPTLRAHPNHLDLHRVAAVVLLRMLQESPVAREIAELGGVPLMLCVLKEQQHEVETVAAACHILYSITHPDAVGNVNNTVDIEGQLITPAEYDKDGKKSLTPKKETSSEQHAARKSIINNLSAVIAVIQKHGQRKDIVRACVRSMVNLSRFRALLAWIDASESIGPILAAAALHSQARDITDSCATLLKGLSRRVRGRPGARLGVVGVGDSTLEKAVSGLLSCLKARPNDMELVSGIFATLTSTLVTVDKSKGSGSNSNQPSINDQWEKDAARVTLVWASMLVRDLPQQKKRDSDPPTLVVTQAKKKGDSKDGESLFWSDERAGCVYQMAKFLRTLVQMRKISHDVVGTSSRLRSSFFSSSSGGGSGSSKVSTGILDVVAAKDVATNLYESLPVPAQGKGTAVKVGEEGSGAAGKSNGSKGGQGQDTAEKVKEGADGGSAKLPAVQVWNELESLLNCLIPATQEVEISEAAAAAAKNAQFKTPISVPPPSSKNDSIAATLLTDASKKGSEKEKGNDESKGGEEKSQRSASSERGNRRGSTKGSKSPTRKMKNKSSSPKRTPKAASTQNYLFTKIKCTCDHGTGSGLFQSRSRPVHPLHDSSAPLRCLHQFSPSELEMIHTGRNHEVQTDSINDRDTDDQNPPPGLLLCYKGGSAAGLGMQSREMTRFPYTVGDNYRYETTYSHSLSFDACFESGNLMYAYQRGPAEYDLFVRPDVHSAAGHMQWYYFAVANTHTAKQVQQQEENPDHPCVSRVKFNICNMQKNDSLFNQGMRPVIYSAKDGKGENPKGWVRTGVPGTISYYQNKWKRLDMLTGSDSGNNYFTLSFTVDFHNANDTYLLAHSYPYTYSDYKVHLSSLLSSPRTSRHMRRKLLCKSLGGHDCDLVTIADFASMENKETGAFGVEETHLISQAAGKRKCIVLSARVHPGEVGASWMMKGVLDFLTSESEQAALLRSIFVFKIIPMLNPDGVIFGNNRTSLSGVDLNRTWKRPVKSEHPTIWNWKCQIRDLKNTYDVVMFVDLHGHSRKMNTFMYGCDDKRKPKPTVRVFPKLLSWNQYGRKYVSFADCNFQVKKGRDGTGRVVVSKELGIQNAYTMEATFCGADFGPLKDVHFNTSHLAESGRALIDTLLDYYMPNPMQREKAANLLKQASERKAARDRSERMAAARAAMQQVRAEQGSFLGQKGKGEKEGGADGGGGVGGGGGGGADSLEKEMDKGLGMTPTTQKGSSAKVNGFMIESGRRSSTSSLQAGTISSAASGQTAGFSGRMRPFNGNSFNNDDNNRSNFSAKRGGISVISNGFMQPKRDVERPSNSAGGIERHSDSLTRRDHYRSSRDSNSASLSVLPTREFQNPKTGTANTQSWLLSTLSRDTQAISDQRKRGTSPSLSTSPSSLSDLHRASPADRHRNVIQPKTSGVGKDMEAGMQGTAFSTRNRPRVSIGGGVGGAGGGGGGGNGMDSLLPRVGSAQSANDLGTLQSGLLGSNGLQL